jgi:ubiquinone/menaquinone biosynthesis C-methylase UbiE
MQTKKTDYGDLGNLLLFPEYADIETSSDEYAKRFNGKTGQWLLKVQEDAILDMLKPYPEAEILDIGGGHGQVTGALVRDNHQVTVLGSAESCKYRIYNYVSEGLCKFHVGNIINLPFPDQSFDVVMSFRLLPHVESWEKLLEEAGRVARKAIIIDYPELYSVNYFTPFLYPVKKYLEIKNPPRPYTCFRESELVKVMKHNGFVRSERFAEFFLPMVLHRVMGSKKVSMFLERIFRSTGLTEKFGSPVILKLVRDNIMNMEV